MKTRGVWEPLALAEIVMILTGIWRDLRGDEKMKLPKLHQILRGWVLPFTAEAVEADDREREAVELLESVKKMARRQNGGCTD